MAVSIWDKIRKGNSEAFEALYDTYIDELYAFGMRVSGDKSTVMDCIHDLFLDIYKYRSNLSATTNVKYYLLASLKRKIYAVKQHDSKAIALIPGYLPTEFSDSIEEETIRRELNDEQSAYLNEAIESLSERQRHGVRLRFYGGKSYTDIAQILDVSIESSRTIVYRAIKQLRQHIATDDVRDKAIRREEASLYRSGASDH